MSKFALSHFANDQALARTAATEWLQQLGTAKPSHAPYCVALSGGRIARRFFSAVADLAKGQGARLATVHFFWGDERGVPPTDPESNFAVARECLFVPLGIPDSQVHRVPGEEPPQVAAAKAAAELSRIAALDRNGQPLLDLIFLGMGEDGHVASLFPGETEAVMAGKAIYRAVNATKPPPSRITLGYAPIAAAHQVWVLASGPGKGGALRESLAPTGTTPLARVLRRRAQTRILTDISF